ncbi:MAG TPA: hypothetical protein PL048_26460, partial [Leptospiraceae bacterium]|nr:hypothetical protein [Leptospiraceae bacterium]
FFGSFQGRYGHHLLRTSKDPSIYCIFILRLLKTPIMERGSKLGLCSGIKQDSERLFYSDSK